MSDDFITLMNEYLPDKVDHERHILYLGQFEGFNHPDYCGPISKGGCTKVRCHENIHQRAARRVYEGLGQYAIYDLAYLNHIDITDYINKFGLNPQSIDCTIFSAAKFPPRIPMAQKPWSTKQGLSELYNKDAKSLFDDYLLPWYQSQEWINKDFHKYLLQVFADKKDLIKAPKKCGWDIQNSILVNRFCGNPAKGFMKNCKVRHQPIITNPATGEPYKFKFEATNGRAYVTVPDGRSFELLYQQKELEDHLHNELGIRANENCDANTNDKKTKRRNTQNNLNGTRYNMLHSFCINDDRKTSLFDIISDFSNLKGHQSDLKDFI